MDNSVNFARRFAHLVWLIIHEPANVDEQKGTLRALVAQVKDGAYHIGVHGSGLTANDRPVPLAFTGATDLLAQMDEHGLVLLSTDANATAADLLAVARIVAGPAQRGDHGAAAEAQRVAARVATVRFAARPQMLTDVSRATPRSVPSIPIDIDFGEIYDDPVAEAMARATPRSNMAIPTPSKSHDTGGLFAQFSTSAGPTETHTELFEQLDKATDIGMVDRVLDGLVMLAERAAKEGRMVDATHIMCSVTRREQAAAHEMKRSLGMAHRRMAKPAMLRAVATQLGVSPELTKDCIAIFARSGEEGTEALVDLISDPAHQRDRRLYVDLLVQLKAEQALAQLARNADERVRLAASGALMRLGTPRSMQMITEALASHDHELRIEAAGALGQRKDAQAVPVLLRALDAERDEVVQKHLMIALGRQATAEALKRLVTATSAERGFFKRKSTAFRVAAVQALAEARTPEALDALRSLQDDKESEVSNAATFSLRRISRGEGKTSEP